MHERAMRLRFIPTLLLSVAAPAIPLSAQDLSPRAYVITPVHSNAVILTWSFYDGGLNLNGTVPITGATATYQRSGFQLLPFPQLLRTVRQHHTRQSSSRIGGTLSVPLAKHQAIKV